MTPSALGVRHNGVVGMVMAGRSLVCASGGLMALLLAVSGCGGDSDSSDSASSDKSSKSASSKSASPSAADSARPVRPECVSDKVVSKAMGTQFVAAGQPKMGTASVECDYIGPNSTVLIYTAQNFAPSKTVDAYQSTMANQQQIGKRAGVVIDFEKNGIDAGLGEESKYLPRPTGIAVLTYDANGTVVFGTLNTKTPDKLKDGFFDTVGSALDLY